MILSVSRRTDVPAFFHGWFFNRLREGFALVRNPFNPGRVSRVTLNPDVVDCIVFWTKNPGPMIPALERLSGYHYYFQFTLNPYGRDVETRLPDKSELIDVFRRLSDRLGPHRVVWRYDPVFVSEKYTVSYHAENFGRIAAALKGRTEKVTISFIDPYPWTKRDMACLMPGTMAPETKNEIAGRLAALARENSLAIDTCAEDIDLSGHGIQKAKCIDDNLIARVIGCPVDVKKDRSQRLECGCVASVDIGQYDTCMHGCLYCYANRHRSAVRENVKNHDSLSPLLVGGCPETDTYTEREARSDRGVQYGLFDPEPLGNAKLLH